MVKHTQDLAEELLYAEARLGEMLEKQDLSEKRASSAKGTCTLPSGIDKKQRHVWGKCSKKYQTFIVLVRGLWNVKTCPKVSTRSRATTHRSLAGIKMQNKALMNKWLINLSDVYWNHASKSIHVIFSLIVDIFPLWTGECGYLPPVHFSGVVCIGWDWVRWL